MTPADDEDDDFAALFAGGGDAAPPDPDFLARLRDLSADAFVGAAPASPRPNHGRFRMLPLLLRVSAAAVAAAILIGVAVRVSRPAEPAAFAQVLDRVADADTLHLRVTKDGRTAEVWVAQSNRLRWDDSAERYLIVRGPDAYRIDEASNRVTRGVADYFRPDRPGLDVFALLGLPRPTPDAIQAAQSERTDRDGQHLDVYRIELAGRDGPVHVEAEADPATGGLRAVAVRNAAAQVVASLVVLAQGQPVPEEKFAVKPTLAADGRVGKVADVQGLVSVKPVGGDRWTPVRANVLLMPGDWVRADRRGANAATLRLLPQASVVVGPGGLLEVVKPTQVTLHEGEAELTPAKKTPIELTGPDGQKQTVTDRTHVRVEKGQLVRVAKEPLWLKGFKGTAANESLGSLVATVDGRNVPLSVGTHKVSVEIRDQIARTTIEETFVNHTDAQLEGQFHFPLPQDASIAGFAMWIGDDMVEADVVEKQRAREIYEEIMRERRDPGLLEWTGGNVFKARVWPIFAHSEKRIRITYTQVLPLKGKQYRYSYALNSEMLQLNPLKDLSIDLRVSSAVPLKAVTSPTHSVRSTKTDHAARLEFVAQEYTPTKDFEAVIEVADAAAQVAVIPHRRGGDGYFLVQVTPPAPAAGDRDLIAAAGPLNVVLLCDTSASMDPAQRGKQHALAAALLEALTPADTFNLGACDVTADWAFDRPRPATPENVAAARQFLVGRVSLGWTDLDKAFDAALKQIGAAGHVVYLGDGIVTTGDANPQAFSARLAERYKASGTTAALHAVALGSAFELGVLAAVGRLGGGSVRHVTAEQGPVPVALELLGEITKPPVRDLKVEFRGWRTASVYPEALPNLVPGTQQILIGRYLPEGKTQAGEVVVTGKLNGQDVRYAAKATLADAEQGNSFLPRLWARMHLDKLLAQPQTDAVRDEVIALSEEFHIMTPYTSFLVLESDADRERFQVKRRFLMRDGEQFFAQGRAKAEYDLAREQMKKAGAWRTGLRRDVLSLLGGLGRNAAAFQPRQPYYGRGGGGGKDYYASRLGETEGLEQLAALGVREEDEFRIFDTKGKSENEWFGNTPARFEGGEPDAGGIAGRPGGGPEPAAAYQTLSEAVAEKVLNDLAPGEYWERGDRFGDRDADGLYDFRGEARKKVNEAWGSMPDGEFYGGFGGRANLSLAKSRMQGRGYYQPQRWFDPLFPNVPAATPAAPPKSTWPQEARDLARSLLRRDALAKLAGGLKLEREVVTFDPITGTATGRDRRLELVSPAAWAVRSAGDHAATQVEWYDGKERGAYRPAFGLGRVRAATPADRAAPLNLIDYSTEPLDASYAHLTAAVEKVGDMTVLVLTQRKDEFQMRLTIDPAKRVVLKVEQFHRGKPTNTTTYSDFAAAGGTWWANRIETRNADGKRVGQTIQSVAAMGDADFTAAVKTATAGRDATQVLRSPEAKVADAKKAIAGGKSTADDHFALLNHFAGYQQWAKAGEHLDAIEKLAAGKPGVRWLRTVFLQASRRGEELRVRLLDEADKLAARPPGDRLALAELLHNQAQAALATNEVLALIDRLAPVYADLPKGDHLRQRWQHNRAYALSNAGRAGEALALWKELAAENPSDYSAQTQYANALFNRGDHPAALAWLRASFAPDRTWERWAADSLRSLYADWLERLGRVPDLIAFTREWTEQVPETDYGYQRHLSALVRGGEAEKAAGLVAAWLKDAQVAGDVPAAAVARFKAAAQLAVGRGHSLSTDRLDDRWLKSLAEAAIFFYGHPKHYALADQITGQPHFRNTDAGRAVTKELFARLVRDLAETPTPQLTHRVAAAINQGFDGDAANWKTIVAELQRRWPAETDPTQRYYLAETARDVTAAKLGREELLALLRVQLKDGPASDRPAAAGRLLDSLLAGPWTTGHEAEALALLADLGPADQPDQRAVVQVGALHRLTDRLVQARTEALKKDLPHPEKLTRTELAAKQAEHLAAARRGVAEGLAKAALPEALRPWATAERIYLLARAGADPKALAGECWAHLGAAPKARPETDEPSPRRALDNLLEDRFVTMALAYATKDPTLVERTLKYLDAGIAADPTDAGWKAAKFQLLVALDRPQDLEAALSAWAKTGDSDGRWRTALGYVLAEQGKLADAIAQFEAVEKADELGSAAYRALAGWYLAVNKRDSHERALLHTFKALDEDTLARLLYAKVYPWTRGGVSRPTELDPDTLRVFAVLFEKSTYPANHLHQLRAVYGACRDFRLLAVMVDAVIGQSAGKVYPFLQAAQSVLTEVRDEATSDELLAHVEMLRPTAKSATDLRALDLLEVQVRQRAAELQNQAGPHAAQALAAMKRAFARDWADGERLMMSNLLRDLGTVSRQDLADEQLRELRELHAAAKPGTLERLHMAHNTGTVLGYQNRHADGIILMRKALDEYAATFGGAFPADAESLVQTMVSFHQHVTQYGGAEDLLVTLLKKPANDEVRRRLTVQLYELYLRALEVGQAVELGAGQKLYAAVEPRLVKSIDEPDPTHRGSLVKLLGRLYRTAKMKTQADVAADAKTFAHKLLPPLLKKNPTNYEAVVGEVARALRDVAGQEEGIVFLLDRIDGEPAWLRLNNADGWNQYGSWLAEWRSTAPGLPLAVEGRLLKLTLDELRRDLRTRTARNRHMYYAGHSYYWKEKEDAFAHTSEDVLAEKKDSGEGVAYVAEYFFHGCNRPDRAIEVMFAAHARKLLADGAQVRLVEYLHWRNRYAEAPPILVPLVARAPDVLSYRALLCQAYLHSGREAELKAAFAAAEAHFRHKDRWGEPAMASLAHTALKCRLFDRSAAIYGELIPLHQRSAPNRGVGDGTLSTYYTNQARAFAGLGKTIEAVDAAGGAVVSWGNNINRRSEALAALKQAIAESPDLEKFVTHLNAQTAESGLINPVVRKALGQVYFDRGNFPAAVTHLQLAMAGQPNDAETQKLLIDCHDKMMNPAGAVAQLHAVLDLTKRDIHLYEDLGKRYAALGQPGAAERAFTSVVEVLPNEAEGHVLLAEIRQRQDRWVDAFPHWEQAARLRALEPTGLLGLAEAQLHERQYDKAAETVGKLNAKTWPAHFPNAPAQIANLGRRVRDAKK